MKLVHYKAIQKAIEKHVEKQAAILARQYILEALIKRRGPRKTRNNKR